MSEPTPSVLTKNYLNAITKHSKISQLLTDPDMRFKSCQVKYIVVLKMLPCTKTNESRTTNNTTPNNAIYRGSEFEVVMIFNKFRPEDQPFEIENSYYHTKLKYIVGKIAKADSFNDDIEILISHGINYFKSFIPAFFCELTCHRSYTGKVMNWFNDGQFYYECEYINGNISGPYRMFHHGTEKFKYIGEYGANGNKINKWSEFFPSGKTKSIEYFSLDGKKHGQYLFYDENGIVLIDGNFKENKKDGKFIYKYTNDIIKSSGKYINGKEHGSWTYNYENGKPRMIGDFFHGIKHGKWIEYDIDGKLTETCYSYGSPIDVKPTDVKPVDVKSTDVKPIDVKPTDVKPIDVKPTDVKPVNVKPTDVKPTDVKPIDVKPIDVKSTDVKSTDVKPVNVKPTDVKPLDIEIMIDNYQNHNMTVEGSYKLGEKNGRWVFKNSDGSLRAAGNYINNEKTGKWTFWEENGDIYADGYYECNKKNKLWMFYQKNSLKEFGSYYDNIKVGKWTYYDQSGKNESNIIYH